MSQPNRRSAIALSLALGVLGGGALIVTVANSSRGPLIFLPYAALVIATGVFLRYARVDTFVGRFASALGAFMLATVILYVYIGAFQAGTLLVISPLGHLWRLGVMFAIGAIVSAAIAVLSEVRSNAAVA